MTRERKILLSILGLLTFIFLLMAIHDLWAGKREDLLEKIRLSRSQVERLQEQQSSAIAEDDQDRMEAMRLYQSQNQQILLYPFGQEIKERFEALGLKVSRYQEITSGDNHSIEFHLEGEPYQILTFLQDQEKGYMRIDSFSLDIQNPPARISLRITPLSLPKEFQEEWKDFLENAYSDSDEISPPLSLNRNIPVNLLSRIFPLKTVAVKSTVVSPEPAPIMIPEPTVDRSSISFVGKVSPDGKDKLLYFKDNRNGRVFSLSLENPNQSEWKLKEKTDRIYLLENNNRLYEVNP